MHSVKRNLTLAGTILILVATVAVAIAAEKPKHRVVFDLSVNEPQSFQALLGNIKNLRKAFGPENVEVRVVTYSRGVELLLLKQGEVAGKVDQLSAEGVIFDACLNTLVAKKVGQTELRPRSVIIDSGVAELARLQEQGWSYIKVASYPPPPPISVPKADDAPPVGADCSIDRPAGH